jgi:hypothetical protein
MEHDLMATDTTNDDRGYHWGKARLSLIECCNTAALLAAATLLLPLPNCPINLQHSQLHSMV